jgi:hypothetical protein
MIFRRGLWLLAPLMALFISGCGPKSKSQLDCGFVQNVYGERISWKGKLPILLYIHKSFPSSYYTALDRAIRAWDEAAGKPLFRVVGYGVYAGDQPAQDGINMIYFMNQWESNKKTEQGRTSVYWFGDEIREADVRVNAKDFNYFQANESPNLGAVNLDSLLVHELGHVVGLKHNDVIGDSVMGTYLMNGRTRIAITEADKQNLNCEYQ